MLGQTDVVRRYSIDEIPNRVKQNIVKKWEGVPWSKHLWMPCSLCRYVQRCDFCPLPPTGWCTKYGDTSRLHLEFHDGVVEKWRADRDEFVVWLRKSIQRNNSTGLI